MSREIKFRVWDKDLECMHICGENSHDSVWFDEFNIFQYHNLQNGDGSGEDGAYELMEYTGFKDKNGKEIYEGDIVELYDDEDLYRVEYQAENARFILTTNTIVTDFEYYSHGEIEVTGNIYENPELT